MTLKEYAVGRPFPFTVCLRGNSGHLYKEKVVKYIITTRRYMVSGGDEWSESKEVVNFGGKKMESLKAYLKKHNDVIYTLGVLALLDYTIFGGKFTKKIELLINKLLDRVIK